MYSKDEAERELKSVYIQASQLKSSKTPEFKIWKNKTQQLLNDIFTEDFWISFKFSRIKYVVISPYHQKATMEPLTRTEFDKFPEAIEEAKAYIEQAILDLAKHGKFTMERKESMSKNQKNVFVSHGGSGDWLHFSRYIEEMGYRVIELSEQASRGKTIIEKLEYISEKCSYAVIVMTGEDFTKDEESRVRQNVMHEIGYFQGKFGRTNVCLIHEKGIEMPSNLGGIVYINYEKGHHNQVYRELQKELVAFFEE